jgi:hypothetical protein
VRGKSLVRARRVLLLVAWLGGCATGPSAPLPPGARAVYAFEVETYLGRRFSGYGVTPESCRARRDVELAMQTSTAPERAPFYRTSVMSRCHAATLTPGGYAWGVEAEQAWGAVMPSAALCDAMRDTLRPSVPADRLGPCMPVTLAPR